MKGIFKFLLPVFLLLILGQGEVFPAEPLTIRSRSGQFVVRGVPSPRVGVFPGNGSGSLVRLEPTVLAVSCERIKQKLYKVLGLREQWKGRIYLNLHDAVEDQRVRLVSLSYSDGWSYRLDLPDEMEPDRLTRTIVEVLLREVAGRRAGRRQAEIPAWLREGLVGHVQAITGSDFILTPHSRVVTKSRATDSMVLVRRRLGSELPLSLERLSWPTAEDWVDGGLVYKASAQLLVAELLRLKEGPRRMANLLALLPEYLNWQLAFLHAYGEQFPTLIQFDKWWSVNTVSFSNHGQLFRWDGRATVKRLEEILSIPVEVRLSDAELPLRTVAKLQSVIREWEYAQQARTLGQKMNYLQALSLRSPVEYIGLIHDYRAALGNYLRERNGAGSGGGRRGSADARQAVAVAVSRLDELDRRRKQLAGSLVPAEQVRK